MKQAEAQIGKLYTIPDHFVFVRTRLYAGCEECRASNRTAALRDPAANNPRIQEIFKSRAVLVTSRQPLPRDPRKERANCEVLVEGQTLLMSGHSWKYMHEVTNESR